MEYKNISRYNKNKDIVLVEDRARQININPVKSARRAIFSHGGGYNPVFIKVSALSCFVIFIELIVDGLKESFNTSYWDLVDELKSRMSLTVFTESILKLQGGAKCLA